MPLLFATAQGFAEQLPAVLSALAALIASSVAAWNSWKAGKAATAAAVTTLATQDHVKDDVAATKGVKADVAELHGMVNDRLTQLLKSTAAAAHAEGRQAERAAMAMSPPPLPSSSPQS